MIVEFSSITYKGSMKIIRFVHEYVLNIVYSIYMHDCQDNLLKVIACFFMYELKAWIQLMFVDLLMRSASLATNHVKEKQTTPKRCTPLNLYGHWIALENCKLAPKCSCSFLSVHTTQQCEIRQKENLIDHAILFSFAAVWQ